MHCGLNNLNVKMHSQPIELYKSRERNLHALRNENEKLEQFN